MIICHLIGGLGNQMFQYACALRVASERRAILKLDLTGFATQPLRRYALDNFRISAEVASDAEVQRFRRRAAQEQRMPDWLKKRLPGGRHMVVRERSFAFDPDAFEVRGNLLLEGYWQSEKYFLGISERLRGEFRLRHPPGAANAALAARMASVNSVSVHVRRGDYVADPAIHEVHGVCTLDYYQQAVRMIAEREPDARFFVFSDDPEWVKQHLRLPYSTVQVEGNLGRRDCDDLWLMSSCRHNIIANSSFSWWGAWLNRNPAKIVMAPARWFNCDGMDTRDLLPAAWTKI